MLQSHTRHTYASVVVRKAMRCQELSDTKDCVTVKSADTELSTTENTASDLIALAARAISVVVLRSGGGTCKTGMPCANTLAGRLAIGQTDTNNTAVVFEIMSACVASKSNWTVALSDTDMTQVDGNVTLAVTNGTATPLAPERRDQAVCTVVLKAVTGNADTASVTNKMVNP